MRYQSVRFSGGLSWSADWPNPPPDLRVLNMPQRLLVPVINGEPGMLAQQVGRQVSRGEHLLPAALESHSAILAPADGVISGVETASLFDGRQSPALCLQTSTDIHPEKEEEAQEEPADLPQWVAALRHSGLWADRATCPDLIGQLMAAANKPVESIICNLLDPDPPLRLWALLGRQSATVLVAGLAKLAQLTGARRTMIAVESGAPSRWWAPLEREAASSNIPIIALPHRYPQWHPSLLIYNLLGRRLRPNRLPMDHGVLLLDAPSAVGIGRRISRRQPMLQMPVGIRDHATGRSYYLVAPIGMSLADILAQVNLSAGGGELLAGQWLRERGVSPSAVVAPVESTIHLVSPTLSITPDPCIRCGWCAESCPTRVQPAGLLEAAQYNDASLAEHYGLDACIDCGVCEHVCPSRLPLLTAIRKLKERDFRE